MTKYSGIGTWLKGRNIREITLSMEEIEKILGFPLTSCAYVHTAWWANSRTKDHPQSRAWTDAGSVTFGVHLNADAGKITEVSFRKQ